MPPTRQVSNATGDARGERGFRSFACSACKWRCLRVNPSHSVCVLLVCCAVCSRTHGLPAVLMRMQHPCALSSEQCSGALQSLTEEKWELVRGRCATDERVTYDAAVICKRHADEWLHWYKPTRCAACPRPLSSSARMPCPEWMREQLGAPHGAFVHVRPCYLEAVAAKKQQTADTQPMEVEQENELPNKTFQLDVSQHTKQRQGVSCTCNTLTHFSLRVGRPNRRKQLGLTCWAKQNS